MSLVLNGVIVPEDIANAISVNGIDITKVISNGVETWKQELFSAIWSGNSIADTGSNSGIEISGSQFRNINATTGWLTAQANGTFSPGRSYEYSNYSGMGPGMLACGGISSAAPEPNSINVGQSDMGTEPYSLVEEGLKVLFDIENGFSGGGDTGTFNEYYLEVSGGLLRTAVPHNEDLDQGSWISLT